MSGIHDNQTDFLAEFHSEVALSRAGGVLRRIAFGHEFGFQISKVRGDAVPIDTAVMIKNFGTIDHGSTRSGFTFYYFRCIIEVVISDVGGRVGLRFVVRNGSDVVADIVNVNAQGRQNWEQAS